MKKEKKFLNKKSTESNINFIKCNKCDLFRKTDSGLKVHRDLMHMNVSDNQDELECSHCPKTSSDSKRQR